MDVQRDNSFYEFLRETQLIFAIWGVFGILLFYLISIFINSQNSLTAIASNITNITQPAVTTLNIQVTILPLALVADFFMFIIVSLVISNRLLNWSKKWTINIEENKFDVFIGLAFLMFFAFFVLFLTLDIILSFFLITTNYLFGVILIFEFGAILIFFYSDKNIKIYTKKKEEMNKPKNDDILFPNP